MSPNPWQRRIARAQKLAIDHSSAAEVLRFFVPIARFQEGLYQDLESAAVPQAHLTFDGAIWPGLADRFSIFLAVAEEHGPDSLAEAARKTTQESVIFQFRMLNDFWLGNEPARRAAPEDFLVRAFLQPYAEFVRSRIELRTTQHTPRLCPFCNRKPGVGILRPLGDGGQRSLLCSLCLAEWTFRRIVCPGCGEENHAKLPVYQAEEFDHMRVECCDACKTYIKTVDLTKNGLAEPIVDDLASIPLDLWAQQQGYSKLQPNLLQF